MTHLTTRARELAARERKLYDQTTIPAVLEELADEADKLRAEAANSAAQRDEAIARATQAEERLRAVEARCEALGREANMWKYGQPDFAWSVHLSALAEAIERAERAEAELARIRAADRTSITAEAKAND